jgi:hypothetical protein
MSSEIDYVEILLGFRCLDTLTDSESMLLIHLLENFMNEQNIPYRKPSLTFVQKIQYKQEQVKKE